MIQKYHNKIKQLKMQPTPYYGLNYGTMLQKNQISKPLLQNEKENDVVEKFCLFALA